MSWLRDLLKRWFGTTETPKPPAASPKTPPTKPLRRGKCHVTEKVRFITREAAVEAEERLKHKFPRQRLRVYKCEFCPDWHLTSKKRFDW